MHPALDVKSLSHFTFSVRRVALLAASGSESAFATVRSLMSKDSGKPAHQFIAVLFANLDPDRIPDPDVLVASEAGSTARSSVAMASHSIEALALCRAEIPAGAYCELWQRMWIWVRFIDLHGLESPADDFLCQIALRMALFLTDTTTATLMKATPEVRVFVSRAWAVIVSRAELGHALDSLLLQVPMCTLSHFLDDCHTSSTHLDDFVEGVGGHMHDLARLIVRYIAILLIPPAAPVIESLLDRLGSILQFVGQTAAQSSTGNLSALREPLLSAGVVRVVTTVLFKFRDCGLKGMLHHCIDIIIVFTGSAGFPGLPEALDEGLLPAIITCSGRGWSANHPVSGSLTRFIGTILPLSTVHHPVLVALEGALPTVATLQHTPSFVASAYVKIWDDFVTLAQERLQVLQRFRLEGYISRRACDNLECGVIKVKTEFKRCSGCLDHLYCSSHCQTVSWKEQGHRAACDRCPQVPDLNFGEPLVETKRDHLFRLFLLQTDYRRLKLTILLQKLAHIHKTNDTNFCTVFAYGSATCIARVGAGEDWAHMLPIQPRIALSAGRMELHLVLSGGADCSLILFRSSTAELTDGLVRIAGKIPPESLTLGRATQSYEADQSDVWALCIILLNLISGAFPWLKAVNSDAGWCIFLLSDTYLMHNCFIFVDLNDLLRKCFRSVPGERPSLDELRYDITNMKSLLKVNPELAQVQSSLLTVPRAHVHLSAPSTADTPFDFSPSDYPSPATSDATSIFIPASLVTSSPSLAKLSPATQEMITRLALHRPGAQVLCCASVRSEEAVAQPAQAALPLVSADAPGYLDEEN
ncbi:hypothetical protein C8R44DRAFT_979190 [Mycena epipterygia]|nr:hypothetical protein C8R44DRAFT_979190 [Mycena epipterygia]